MLIEKESLLKKFESGALLFQPDIRRIIEEEPEAVVRCKDCMYNPQICFIGCPVDVPVEGDFFCARGKRRDDERSD